MPGRVFLREPWTAHVHGGRRRGGLPGFPRGIGEVRDTAVFLLREGIPSFPWQRTNRSSGKGIPGVFLSLRTWTVWRFARKGDAGPHGGGGGAPVPAVRFTVANALEGLEFCAGSPAPWAGHPDERRGVGVEIKDVPPVARFLNGRRRSGRRSGSGFFGTGRWTCRRGTVILKGLFPRPRRRAGRPGAGGGISRKKAAASSPGAPERRIDFSEPAGGARGAPHRPGRTEGASGRRRRGVGKARQLHRQ